MHGFAKAAAIIMAVALFTGCGSSDTKTAGTAEPIGDKTLAAEFSDHLDNGDYDITMNITGDTAVSGTECRMIRHGDDGFVSMDRNNVYTEFYTVGGVSYMVMPAIRCYRLNDERGIFGNAFIRIGKGDDLFDISESDDSIEEVYTSVLDGVKEKFTFTFAKPSNTLEKVVSETNGNVVTTEISDIMFESEPVELPDFTEWDNISDDANISDVTEIKFSFYVKGITPEMVTDAGYSYKELAKMTSEQTEQVAEEILAKNTDSKE